MRGTDAQASNEERCQKKNSASVLKEGSHVKGNFFNKGYVREPIL